MVRKDFTESEKSVKLPNLRLIRKPCAVTGYTKRLLSEIYEVFFALCCFDNVLKTCSLVLDHSSHSNDCLVQRIHKQCLSKQTTMTGLPSHCLVALASTLYLLSPLRSTATLGAELRNTISTRSARRTSWRGGRFRFPSAFHLAVQRCHSFQPVRHRVRAAFHSGFPPSHQARCSNATGIYAVRRLLRCLARRVCIW